MTQKRKNDRPHAKEAIASKLTNASPQVVPLLKTRKPVKKKAVPIGKPSPKVKEDIQNSKHSTHGTLPPGILSTELNLPPVHVVFPSRFPVLVFSIFMT